MTEQSPGLDVHLAPRRLGHANLFVGRLDRSLAFYSKVCGLELVRLEPEIEAGFLTAGTSHHDVGLMEASPEERVGLGGHVQIPAGRGKQPGLNHFGWEMESEAQLVAGYRRARDAGVRIFRTTDHQISHSVYIFDPDGNLNEFYADAIEDWRTIFNLDREELISGHWDPEAAAPDPTPMYDADPEIRVVEDAIFHPVTISHSVLVARNFERMRAFYTEVAGLSAIEDLPQRTMLTGARGRFNLAIVAASDRAGPGLHHIAFELASEPDIETAVRRLQEQNVRVLRTVDTDAKCGVVAADPDGMLVEFAFPRDGAGPAAGWADIEDIIGLS